MRDDFIIFDGAMGTELNSLGLMSECNEILNINNPKAVLSIHRAYYNSGAQYVKTNSFGGSVLKLRKSGNEDNCKRINSEALKLARMSGAKAAGDIGPSGELYFPFGEYGTQDIYDSFLVQASALIDSDVFLIETMSSLVEANLAYLAIRSVNKTAPIIISFTFTNGYTMMGCTPELIAKAFNGIDVWALGTNCSGGPLELKEVVREFKKYSNKRITAMPNAGLPEVNGDTVDYPFGAGEFAEAMKGIIEEGASIIGGCCGTTPAHIKALNQLDYDGYTPSAPNNDNTIYAATEREFRPISSAVSCPANEEEILGIEDSGKITRIDVRNISDLKSFMDDLNLLSSVPKCFTARKDQEQLIRILYHGITDIEIT